MFHLLHSTHSSSHSSYFPYVPLAACAAALALASAPAGAQSAPRADDARAAVPETHYHAAQAYRPAERATSTPDRHWIEANRTVAGYNSMMLTMPGRAAPRQPAPAHPASQPGSQPGSQPASQPPSQRGSPPASHPATPPVPPAAAHAGHGMEGHH